MHVKDWSFQVHSEYSVSLCQFLSIVPRVDSGYDQLRPHMHGAGDDSNEKKLLTNRHICVLGAKFVSPPTWTVPKLIRCS